MGGVDAPAAKASADALASAVGLPDAGVLPAAGGEDPRPGLDLEELAVAGAASSLGTLEPGDEAWCIVQTDPTPSGRRTLVGAARTRIEARDGDRFRARVVRGSGVVVGHVIECARHDLYADNAIERDAFVAAVRRLWGIR